MFSKILIANRGEIACRIIETARRLNVATVAVYSEADAGARHVRLADEAVLIGPAAARESYLCGDRILAAAKRTGAEAIHPGYGFLSENAGFAAACAAAGIAFIGPPVKAIEAMGSKSAAKALMGAAGVPLTPGYHGDEQDPAHLAAEAGRIGFPVLIKASAGGGGKGMRRVDRAEDFADALASCQREAASAFGDEHVLVEKYVLQPRHIEVQVFADTHGNAVHLFERDCSVQRRHQKVLEEAPAPGMTAERRAAMGQAAVDAARAVNYVGAGTVEFIVNPDGSFYFMEMNTRLQVEHPVTEMITGLDLVEWQLRVANGEPLPLTQTEIRFSGHALEARLYAEDPDAGFLPATGTLHHLRPPTRSANVRVDTGVEQGDAISPHYDPMIAKLIVWDEDRPAALARMRRALGDFQVAGVANNLDFLARLVTSTAFTSADLDTALIEREQEHIFPAPATPPAAAWILAALAEALPASQASAGSPWNAHDNWRLNGHGERCIILRAGELEQSLRVAGTGDRFVISFGDDRARVTLTSRTAAGLAALIDDAHHRADVVAQGSERCVFIEGRRWAFEFVDPTAHAGGEDDGDAGLLAPMPGKVIELVVSAGTRVSRGDRLLVLEAMKMEHAICAPADGVVKDFFYAVGEQVDEGVELVDFEASAS